MEINLMYWACSPFQHVSPAAWVVLASLLNFRVMMVRTSASRCSPLVGHQGEHGVGQSHLFFVI
jgi:hypothetical protein